jgi:hypothetical protein
MSKLAFSHQKLTNDEKNGRLPLKGDAPSNSSSVIFLPEYGQIQLTSYFHKTYKKLLLKVL